MSNSEKDYGTMTSSIDRRMLTIRSLHEGFVLEKEQNRDFQILLLKAFLADEELGKQESLQKKLNTILESEKTAILPVEAKWVLTAASALLFILENESDKKVNPLYESHFISALRILWLKGEKLWEEKKTKATKELKAKK